VELLRPKLRLSLTARHHIPSLKASSRHQERIQPQPQTRMAAGVAGLADRKQRHQGCEIALDQDHLSMPLENSPKVPGENSLVSGVGDQPAC